MTDDLGFRRYSPLEAAMAVYEREPCARPFETDLAAHLAGGWAISTPEVFLMMRPVPRNAEPEHIVNPWHIWAPDDCDAWMVYLAAGDLSRMPDYLPFEKEWICFERSNVLRFHRLQPLLRRLARCRSTIPISTARISKRGWSMPVAG